jgi:hypothetical protein
LWLATNHFCGEGFWFWTIPLHGKTSLGLVFDNRLIKYDDVSSARKLTGGSATGFRSSRATSRGAASFTRAATPTSRSIARDDQRGPLGAVRRGRRFSDPLYSPGGDLISLYNNTLITDAILTTDDDELRRKAVSTNR